MNSPSQVNSSLQNPLYRRVIAVTGGIASGKTTACEILAENGAIVISADETAREVVATGSKALQEIKAIFGAGVIEADGGLNRQALGKLVFQDSTKRSALENLIHPLIRKSVDQRIERLLASGEKFVVYDVPLLFEGGLEQLGFKAVVVIAASPEVAKKRLMERNKLTESDAQARINSQLPIEEKIKRANALSNASFIVQNNGSVDELKKSISQLIPKLTGSD